MRSGRTGGSGVGGADGEGTRWSHRAVTGTPGARPGYKRAKGSRRPAVLAAGARQGPGHSPCYPVSDRRLSPALARSCSSPYGPRVRPGTDRRLRGAARARHARDARDGRCDRRAARPTTRVRSRRTRQRSGLPRPGRLSPARPRRCGSARAATRRRRQRGQCVWRRGRGYRCGAGRDDRRRPDARRRDAVRPDGPLPRPRRVGRHDRAPSGSRSARPLASLPRPTRPSSTARTSPSAACAASRPTWACSSRPTSPASPAARRWVASRLRSTSRPATHRRTWAASSSTQASPGSRCRGRARSGGAYGPGSIVPVGGPGASAWSRSRARFRPSAVSPRRPMPASRMLRSRPASASLTRSRREGSDLTTGRRGVRLGLAETLSLSVGTFEGGGYRDDRDAHGRGPHRRRLRARRGPPRPYRPLARPDRPARRPHDRLRRLSGRRDADDDFACHPLMTHCRFTHWVWMGVT